MLWSCPVGLLVGKDKGLAEVPKEEAVAGVECG